MNLPNHDHFFSPDHSVAYLCSKEYKKDFLRTFHDHGISDLKSVYTSFESCLDAAISRELRVNDAYPGSPELHRKAEIYFRKLRELAQKQKPLRYKRPSLSATDVINIPVLSIGHDGGRVYLVSVDNVCLFPVTEGSALESYTAENLFNSLEENKGWCPHSF